MNIRNRIKELRVVTPEEVAPNPRNWRTHPQAQRDALRGILAQVGIAAPVIAYETPNGLMLIDGHERMTVGVPFPAVILDVNEQEAGVLLATFDPLTNMAETDSEALDALLREVSTDSPAVAQMLDELAQDAGIVPPAAELTEDEVPAPPVEPVTQPGDLWILGDHRLLCGDSTKAEDVARLMAGQKADCVVTDPPYGINAPAMTLGLGKKNFLRGDWDSERPDIAALLEYPQVIIWGGNYFADQLPVSNNWLCWHKKNDARSYSEFELAWTNLGKNCRIFSHHWSGEEKQHPTQKPLPVIGWCLNMTTGDVYDPFLGSGTTLIAAEQLGRKCYGMEISPAYCDVIVKRWEQLTGRTATLER